MTDKKTERRGLGRGLSALMADVLPHTANDEGELAWVELDRVLQLPLWEGDRYFLPIVFDLAAAQFHGIMPYRNGQPVSWKQSNLV